MIINSSHCQPGLPSYGAVGESYGSERWKAEGGKIIVALTEVEK